DPGVLLYAFRKSQLAFLTKKENYKLPIIRKFMHKILCQPIDRENDRQALKTILKCIQMVKNDQVSIGAFPEGYTSRDGML
ncbi:lysophospholipid acyltransferase family protein, partial [Acinetobacter sp. 163]|nr:lysophospholipid acyltransferase family protein [Acinetobacter sp. 163]